MVLSGPARGAVQARRTSGKARLGVEPFAWWAELAQDMAL
jgi:hypothetical protein